MRRRWKALVVVGAVALLTGLLFLLPPRNDGLDWLKKYKPREVQFRSMWIGSGEEVSEFHFNQLSPGLEREVRSHIVRFELDKGGVFTGSTGTGYLISFSRETKTLGAFREPNWIDQYWSYLKVKLGMS